MSQIEPIAPVALQTPEKSDVSLAVTEVMEQAHKGAMLEIERFTKAETNPIFYYLRGANDTIASILGFKGTSPEYFSGIITLKQKLRAQEAKNDEAFKKAA